MRRQEKQVPRGLRYDIERPLGAGGFGTVYEATDRRTGERLALKELMRSSPSALLRFKQEFRSLTELHHENLVALKELFEHEGRWYIAMELVEGHDLLSFVQGAAAENTGAWPFDEGRLRAAFVGMARGIDALHEHGILHRDLKPSNVRVTPRGRAVLLDFGLVTRIDPEDQSTQAGGLGTAAYMAPEQAKEGRLGPGVDWYAFGTCLYQALTGRLPFEGINPILVAMEKERSEAPRPSARVAGLPADLEELCMALLQREPELRPGAAEVLRRLGAEPRPAARASIRDRSSAPAARIFAGRDGELENLERALSRTHEGELRVMLVEGESGVGKSELVAEFVRRLQARDAQCIVLRGRCYENERVAYKAFDGCIDELSQLLQRMGAEAASLLPANAALLAQLFPVLGDVRAIAKAKLGRVSADPSARRLEAFEALSELLRRLSVERPVLVVIDDLQWADSESFRLLRALVDAHERAPLAVIATVRPRDELEPAVRQALEVVRDWQCTDLLQIVGLPRNQTEGLARTLLGPEADPAWARVIAAESRGHPMLLAELVTYTLSRDRAAGTTVTLEAALKARVKRLTPKARALLELVALAARPHGAQTFARALDLANVEEPASQLLHAKLVRRRRDHELGCFHDRIRNVVVELIPHARLPHLHRQLAEALAEDSGADPGELAQHWELGGDTEEAIDAYASAARRALESLAFVRAEQLYKHALELLGESQELRYGRLLAERAHALACAGLSAEAATQYQLAALRTQGDQHLRLRARAAQQLLLSAQVPAGLRAARLLLAELRIRLPVSELGALSLAAWNRLCTAVRRLFVRSRRPSDEKTERTQLALDLMDELRMVIALIDIPSHIALTAHYARCASDLASPRHMIACDGAEAWLRTARGSLAAAIPLFEKARRAARDVDDPYIKASQEFIEGSARLTGWDWRGAAARLEEAHRLAQAHCPDNPAFLTAIRYNMGAALYYVGEHRRLARESASWLAEARERGDGFAMALISGMGHGAVRHLMAGAPSAALRELDDTIGALPQEPFGLAHVGHLIGTQQALLRVDGRLALRWLDEHRERHARVFLLKTRFGREALLVFRTLAALNASQFRQERPSMLAMARHGALKLGRTPATYPAAMSSLYLSQIDALEGNLESALARARQARSLFESTGHHANHAAAYLEGLLMGASSGRAKCEAVLAHYLEQGWKDPREGLLIALPALPQLDQPLTNGKSRSAKLVGGRYDVVSALGSGGFGNVFEANDAQTGRQVALKELVTKTGRALERFKREFRTLQDLHHPHLARLDALLEHNGQWYIALELLRGTDLIAYVRPLGALEPERLSMAFAGLASAVLALHEAGLVHRDITPDNVRVTPDGRSVLFDFGLIARANDASDTEPVGTVDYAAPEQLIGTAPRASADVYALGVCLYQALYGEVPIDRRGSAPILPVTVAALSPLRNLCARMLARIPSDRPTCQELLAALLHGAKSNETPSFPSLVPVAQAVAHAEFTGRTEELTQLTKTFGAADQGGFRFCVIEGESGVGKSALVAELVRRLAGQHPGAQCVSARCYENEAVSFKAFDGIVDQLAQMLRALSAERSAEILPPRSALLSQLFPVLAGVPAIVSLPKKGLPADPAARRIAAMTCFIELLERLSRKRTLVFVVDDLQWADPESFRLIRALSEHAGALRLFLITTVRSVHELSSAENQQLRSLLALPFASSLSLARLSEREARSLAASLFEVTPPDAVLSTIVSESRGHPLFLRELVEHAKSGGAQVGEGTLSLDSALRARIESFHAEARRLVALSALASRPYGADVFARALGMDELDKDTLSTVLTRGLLQRRGEGELVCCHDRMRQVALQMLGPAERRVLAGKLAQAVGPASDAAERARLWDEAGDAERAFPAYEEAGNAALEGLAFLAAEQYFARALVLLGATTGEHWRRLTIQRARALVRSGRSADAARLFDEAAQTAQGDEQVRLRIWAAQHLLQSAQVKQGLEAASALLQELGVPWPRGRTGAFVRVAAERGRMKLRGVELSRASRAKTSRDELVLEALHELSAPIHSVLFFEGVALSAHHLRRSLDAGEPAHAARALGLEARLRAGNIRGGDQQALFERARALAETTGRPDVFADVLLNQGLAHISRGDFLSARDQIGAAHELIQSRCPGEPWLLTTARVYLGASLWYLGDYAALRADVGSWLVEAHNRHDRYAIASLTGYGMGFLLHLMDDDAQAALSQLTDAMAPWPDEPVSLNHVGQLVGTTCALLYAGGRGSLAWLEQNKARLERAQLLRIPACRLVVAWAQTCSVLSAIERLDTPAGRALMRRAIRGQSELDKAHSPMSPGLSQLLGAALLALQGRTEQAIEQAVAFGARLSSRHYYLAPVARYLAGYLEGGEAGRAKCEVELSALRAAGWAQPHKFIQTRLPVFHLLDRR